MKKYIKIPFCLASISLLVGCSLEVNPTGSALMTAINYEAPTRIVYSRDDAYPTPDGKRLINKGDYKPVWNTIQNRLHITLLEHQAAANSGSKKACDYFRDNWMIKPYADISMGTVYDINNYSVAGSKETILDLKPYLFDEEGNARTSDTDPLPHLAKFLEDNPGVLLSITTAKHSHPDQSAVYYVPYFDGFADLEKGTIMRADYVERVLDDPLGELDNETKNILGKAGSAKYTQHYEPCYVEDDGNAPKYDIEVPHVYEENVYKPSGEIEHYAGDPIDDEHPTFTIHKNEGVENIILKQKTLINSGGATSRALAEQFRTYIDDRYGKPGEAGSPFDKYSDLFLAYKACYDTDELVALMRLIKVSPGSFFENYDPYAEHPKEMITMMPRVCDNQRASDIYRWAGQMFGVRGLESRNGYLYINGIKDHGDYGKYGYVHDARGTDDALFMLEKMNSLYQEGLILQDFDDMTATGTPLGKFADDTLYSGGSSAYAGFMMYDYPKDLDDWNKYESSAKDPDKPCDWVTPERKKETGGGHPYKFRAVVPPVAKWDTNLDYVRDRWMQFTESWASVKTSALCLNAKLVENKEKMAAAFSLVDYAYQDEGMFLLNYGPWEDGYITQKAGEAHISEEWEEEYHPEKGIDYIEYQGTRYPCLTDKAIEQHNTISNLQRERVGATLPFGFKKLNSVPYQTYDPKTREGVDIINKGIELETTKHVLIGGDTEQLKNPFYQICPSAFFLTKGQSSGISALLDKNALGSIFTDSGSSNFNIWDSLIMGKKTRLGVDLDNYLDIVRNSWKVGKLETYYQDAFEIMSPRIEE